MKPAHVARFAALALLPVAVVAPLPRSATPPAMATPVADNDALYTACARVFPDPQAYWPAPTAATGESPWAKGNAVCRATQFIQHAEAISGLAYLERKFADFVEVYDLSEDFETVLDRETGEGLSAGIPISTLQREKSPLTLVRVTDERVPDSGKKLFVFPLSIHGIERAGVEGGLRAIEDLATWGANEPDQPVMETDEESLPVGDVLRRSAVYFVLANPDGWRRGDFSGANPAYQRYNGNGVDMNRDWPAIGFTFRPYTPWSEPETRSFGKVLQSIRTKWDGGIDLHGQLIDRAFSFTLLGASQRPYGKNQRVLQFTKGAWADAEERLAWNPAIKPNSQPPQCTAVEDPTTDPCDNRIYGVQWGTIWDTIAYTVTGAFGDWIDSPLGLDADGIDNEMSLSHLSNCGTGTCYIQSAEQLHVDGNKSLIYAMLNYSLLPEDQTFRYQGKAAYLHHAKRLSHPGRSLPKPPVGVPAQEDLATTITHTGRAPSTYEFDVKGAADGIFNGGLQAIVTFTNLEGVSPGATLTVAVERQDENGDWQELNSDFNQSPIYLQAGMKVDVNVPEAGRYRVRISGPAAVAVDLDVDFTTGYAWPDPGQRPYDVSNMDFFDELKPFVAAPEQLTRVPVESVLDGSVDLRAFDTVIAADGTMSARLGKPLEKFVRQGGNLVLTDSAIQGLAHMGLVSPDAVVEESVYAGHFEFERTEEDETVPTYDDPLAANVQQPGAAEGPNHRHQITEPVPIGYAIQDEDGSEMNSMPQFGVETAAWEELGGRVVGRLGADMVSFGEAPYGGGVVRIVGSLLPMPTEEFDHPFGLADYSITYSGYEVLKNVMSWRNPRGTTGTVPTKPKEQPKPEQPKPREEPRKRPLPATGTEPPYAALAVLGIGLALAARRRLHAR